MSKRVIVDTDAGIDDIFALILLLEHKDVEVIAITCVNGNTFVENVYQNVQRILKLCNKEKIPVYMGAKEPLVASFGDDREFFHGNDGFGDLEYKDKQHKNKSENSENNEQNAIIMLNELVKKNPGEISLICLGPLTNIALTLKIYSKFTKNLKDIFLMGGNYKGIGNVTNSAEFNFYTDPEAAYIVLNYSECAITILPWELCMESTLTLEWRFNVLAKLNHPTIDLLNTVERKVYSNKDSKIWLPCDAYLCGVFLHPEIIKKSFMYKITVELQGVKTRGQMIIMHKEKLPKSSALIITEIDMNQFKTILTKTFTK